MMSPTRVHAGYGGGEQQGGGGKSLVRGSGEVQEEVGRTPAIPVMPHTSTEELMRQQQQR